MTAKGMTVTEFWISATHFCWDMLTPAGMTVTGFWIPASAGMTEKNGMTGKKRHALVIPAVPFDIPSVFPVIPPVPIVIPAVPLVIPAVPFDIPSVFPVIPPIPLVIPAVFLVIPAEAGIQVTGRTGWISATHGGRGNATAVQRERLLFFRRLLFSDRLTA